MFIKEFCIQYIRAITIALSSGHGEYRREMGTSFRGVLYAEPSHFNAEGMSERFHIVEFSKN